MFGILAISRGLFAGTRWVHEGGKVLLFTTREAAENAAEQLNAMHGPVNRFCEYFADQYEDDNCEQA